MIYLSSFISLRWHNHITGRPGTKIKEYNKAIRKLFVLQLSVKWNRRSGDAYLCCWRHDMGLFSTCLVLCEENPLNKWSVMRSFDLFFAVSPSKLLSKQSICRWRRDTQVTSLWWHRNSVKQGILFWRKTVIISWKAVCWHADQDYYFNADEKGVSLNVICRIYNVSDIVMIK